MPNNPTKLITLDNLSTYTGYVERKIVELTQAQYDDLSTAEKNNGTTYFITDATPSPVSASAVSYSNTSSELQSTTVQGALDEIVESLKVVDPATFDDVYGFIEHMDILSPSQRIEYICKNKNYTPLSVNLSTGAYSLGDWSTFPIIVDCKPYMVRPDGTADYQLDPSDYTKKADGSASDVANTSYNGGAFAWIKKVYKMEYMKDNDRYVLFSFTAKDGFEPVGFTNTSGTELTGQWLPMFYGTVVDNKARSLAIGNCITGGNKTTDAQNSAITTYHTNAKFLGGAFVETLNDIMMMLAKSTDTQESYGYGNSSGYINDSSVNYGMLDNAVVGGGMFYGTNDKKSLNKAFHSIVLTTYNQWMRDPYEIVKNGAVKVSRNFVYDLTSNSYYSTGIFVPNQSSSAWRYTQMYRTVEGYGSVPDITYGTASASTALGRCDGVYTLDNQSGGVYVCQRFGSCSDASIAGVSARHWYISAADSSWNIGFALLINGPTI